MCILVACGRGPSPGENDPYGYGWYHRANGVESIGEIAMIYHRDAALVAELNRMRTGYRPIADSRIYVPPYNDRSDVRELLTAVQQDPTLIASESPQMTTDGTIIMPAATTASATPPASLPASEPIQSVREVAQASRGGGGSDADSRSRRDGRADRF